MKKFENDIEKTENLEIVFIRNLADGAALYFYVDSKSVVMALIKIDDELIWECNERTEVGRMVFDWEQVHGHIEPSKEELERYYGYLKGWNKKGFPPACRKEDK